MATRRVADWSAGCDHGGVELCLVVQGIRGAPGFLPARAVRHGVVGRRVGEVFVSGREMRNGRPPDLSRTSCSPLSQNFWNWPPSWKEDKFRFRGLSMPFKSGIALPLANNGIPPKTPCLLLGKMSKFPKPASQFPQRRVGGQEGFRTASSQARRSGFRATTRTCSSGSRKDALCLPGKSPASTTKAARSWRAPIRWPKGSLSTSRPDSPSCSSPAKPRPTGLWCSD